MAHRVQRFFAAAYDGDYAAAYTLLSDTTRRAYSLADIQAQLSGLRHPRWEVRDEEPYRGPPRGA